MISTLNKEFKKFGCETEKACQICGKTPARLEPRFLYIVCAAHIHLNPLKVQELTLKNQIKKE